MYLLENRLDNAIPGLLTPIYDEPVMHFTTYPRKIFDTVDQYADPPILRNYVKMYVDASVKRTCQLLTSFDELKHELRCSVSSAEFASPSELPFPIVPVQDYDTLLSSLNRARQVQVCENDLTRDFVLSRDIEQSGVDDWMQYRGDICTRRLWGEELRSNLDWDWDPSISLKRLFEVERESTPNISVSAVANGPHITVFISSSHANTLEKVDVRIASISEDSKKDESEFWTCIPITIENDAVLDEGGLQSALKGPKTVGTGTSRKGASIAVNNSLSSRDEHSSCLVSTTMGEIDSPDHHDTKAWLEQKELGGSSSDVISICSLD